MPYTDDILGNNYIIYEKEPSTGLATIIRGAGNPPTTANVIATACEYTDTASGNKYTNEGTSASPVWNSLVDIATDDIADYLIKYATYNLTKAQILTLNTAPIEVIAAQGAGTVIEFMSATISYDFVTAAYTGGGPLYFFYTTEGAGYDINDPASDTFDYASDVILWTTANISSPLIANSGISLYCGGGNFVDPGTANGTAKIKLVYRVHTF